MAGSRNGWGISGRTYLDRYLLRDLNELPSTGNWRLEYGDRLWLYWRRLLPSHEMALN